MRAILISGRLTSQHLPGELRIEKKRNGDAGRRASP